MFSLSLKMLKKLLSETAIYGLSSIAARGLYYLLTLIFGRFFLPEDFGIFADLYAMAGFLLVILTHGMETSFFRHFNLKQFREKAFSTAFYSVLFFVVVFLILSNLGLNRLAELLSYQEHPEYLRWFALIISLDVLSAVPFAHLRAQNKAWTFASIKILNIVVLIGFNVLFLMMLPKNANLENIYIPVLGNFSNGVKIDFVFISNLLASALTFLLLAINLKHLKLRFDLELYKRMFRYAFPIMIVGLAGAINELFDRLMLRRLLPYSDLENLKQLGIYGYSYKLAMIMTLFLQAFKYAIEPFYFSEAEKEDAPETYARVTKYFVIVGLFIFLLVSLNLDVVATIFEKMNFDSDYAKGLIVVPILLLANLFLGIYFNVSTWYKVTDKTQYGALIAISGALITIGLNFWWIPTIGFLGSAIATLICYVIMVSMAFYFGQKFYPVPYQLAKLFAYIITATLLYATFTFVVQQTNLSASFLWWIKIILIVIYCLIIYVSEKRWKA